MENNNIVVFEGVKKLRANRAVLDNVNLQIESGRLIGLIGPNGSGKTTLLKHIPGLLLPNQGKCTVFGICSAQLRTTHLAQIGYVPQQPRLIDFVLVGQLIAFVKAHYEKWSNELEKNILERLSLDHRQYLATLSPGEVQKLSFLLALCCNPALLILDEPAANLDPIARDSMLDLLSEYITQSGRTAIISSHNLSDLEKIIDHVVLLECGRIVVDACLDDLRDRIVKVKLIGAQQDLELPFSTLKLSRQGQQILAYVKSDQLERVEIFARESNADLTSSHIGLEESFKLLVKEDVE